MPRITLTSVLVDDQDKALDFYTRVLGFLPKLDIPMGEHRWLTVISDRDSDGTQLVLEPDAHPAAGPFKAALVEDGIPYTSFGVDDVHAETERLTAAGVHFTQPPMAMGPVVTAVFDDTCGNLIQIDQPSGGLTLGISWCRNTRSGLDDRSSAQSSVTGDEWHAECLGECQECCVVRGDVVPQLPDPVGQELMWVLRVPLAAIAS